MRTVGTKWVGLVVTSLLVSGPAIASSSVDEDLAQMRELVKGLEQKVDAQQEQLQHQNGMLHDAQQAVREQQQENEKATLSGVGEFWQAIDVNASVAGSYAYNFRNPTSGSGHSGNSLNQGNSALFYPFHGDHNSFQVDQVWFDIGKATTAESRAGFHATILYGNTAGFLGQGGNIAGIRRRDFSDSTSDYYVHQAYVNWLAPVGEGVNFTFGKFATPIGAEVADASKNWAVTRGNLYNLLQPIDHLGLMASTTFGPVTVGAAVVNEINLFNSSPDINSEKSYLGRVAIGNETVSLATTVAYGAEGNIGPNVNEARGGMVDVLANFNSDRFSAYLNADYNWIEDTRLAAWGLSAAGKVGITEDLSAALRLEWVRDKSNFFGILGPRHSETYGVTGTLAYELAENLTLKTEVRWDKVNENAGGADEFFSKTASGTENQVVGIGQVVYAF